MLCVNNIYYIDIEEGAKIHKYVLDEYVEKIKNNGFFAGFIEIKAMSIIINRPIIIIEVINFENIISLFNKISHFYNSNNTNLEITDIVFINYVNKDHYELLKPKFEFIKKRILKETKIEYNIVEFDIIKSIITDLRNNSNSIREDKLYCESLENSSFIKKANIENKKK